VAFNGDNVRSAVSDDGTHFWVGGAGAPLDSSTDANSSQGVFFVTRSPGGTNASIQIEGTSKSTRICQIFFDQANQLFCDSSSTGFNAIFPVGMGLPQTTVATVTPFPGLPVNGGNSAATPSPNGFVLLDRAGGDGLVDTLYIADDRNPSTVPAGGIQKWTLVAGSWTLSGTFKKDMGTVSVIGLTADASTGSVVLIATTKAPNATSGNTIVRFIDDGITAISDVGATILATSATALSGAPPTAKPVTLFRGISMPPR
jgi:hypothetical protein